MADRPPLDPEGPPPSRVKYVVANRFDGLRGRLVNLLFAMSLAGQP